MAKEVEPTCPECGRGVIQQKTAHSTGRTFYGCSNWKRGCKRTFSPGAYEAWQLSGIVPERRGNTRDGYVPPVLARGTAWPLEIEGTPEQQLIWEYFLEGNSIIVNALAGTGKSTCINQACTRVDGTAHMVVVSFNTKNAEEAQGKVPPNTTAMTVHRLGNIAVQTWMGMYLKPDRFKSANMLEKQWGLAKIEEEDEAQALKFTIKGAAKIVSYLKNYLMHKPTEEEIYELVASHGLDISNLGTAVEMAQWVMANYWKQDVIKEFSIDFDDMVVLPVLLKLKVLRFDAIFVDEAQDLSPARQALIMMASDQWFIVGDTFQSIYGFAGADTRSMEHIYDRVRAETGADPICLPLTVNWRCGVKHIKLAQVLVPDIKWHDGADEGYIHEIIPDNFERIVKIGDMVLCRTNAPMVKYVYRLLRWQIPARIAGKDIAENLIHLIERLAYRKKGKGAKKGEPKEYIALSALPKKLDEYLSNEREKLAKRRDGEKMIELLVDKIDTIYILMDHARTVEDLINNIEDMFVDESKDNSGVVMFYTVHKAKGMERGRVFIIEPQLMPFPKATTEEDVRQEINLLYVAITRILAKPWTEGRLFFVGSMPAILRDQGGASLITEYEGAMREDRQFARG